MTIRSFEPVRPADKAALADEGAQLVAFATDGLAADIVVETGSA